LMRVSISLAGGSVLPIFPSCLDLFFSIFLPPVTAPLLPFVSCRRTFLYFFFFPLTRLPHHSTLCLFFFFTSRNSFGVFQWAGIFWVLSFRYKTINPFSADAHNVVRPSPPFLLYCLSGFHPVYLSWCCFSPQTFKRFPANISHTDYLHFRFSAFKCCCRSPTDSHLFYVRVLNLSRRRFQITASCSPD